MNPFTIIFPFLLILVVVFLLLRFLILGRVAKKEYKRIQTLFGSSKDKLTQEDLILEMAKSYEIAENKKKAIEHYELYLFKKRSSDPEILYKIGNLYGVDNINKAKEYWEKASQAGHQEATELLKTVNQSEKSLS